MEIKVEATAKDLRHTQAGAPYTGVKVQGTDTWINLWGDHRDKKGETIIISEPEKAGGSQWAKVIERQEEPKPKPEAIRNGPSIPGQKTVKDYIHVMSEVYQHIRLIEPSDAGARASLINTLMISWSNGKIV